MYNEYDGFDQPESRGNGPIKGAVVRFKEGDWHDRNGPLPEGSRFLLKSVVTAWTHWKDKKPIEHIIWEAGKPLPKREELGDDDESTWPAGLGDKPEDPWKLTRYVELVDQATGKDFCFVTDNVGGTQAVAEIKSQIMNVRRAHPDAIPEVELGSTSMRTKFGTRSRPQINVVGWVSARTLKPIVPGRSNGSGQHEEPTEDPPFGPED